MSNIKIIPLGGVREAGKNLYVVEVNESIFVMDCGLVFPEEGLLGIDAVIPDFSYLEENADRVVGIFLTHGHADAVGALPYLLEVIEAPVFGTELTIELASLLAKERGLADRLENFFKIDEEVEIEFEDANVSFFRTTHTIPDSVGIVIQTKEGSIVYTGDFRIDPSAKPLYKTHFGRLTDIGESGVLALLADSSEAESHVENVSDQQAADEILETFRNAHGRVIVACVGSNIARLQQVMDAAHTSKRTIFVPGGELMDIVDTAIKLDKLIMPSKRTFGQMKNIGKFKDHEIIILETGMSGEPIQALQLMAQSRHRQVKMQEGDLVLFASTPSIAIETAMARTQDMIYRAGAQVKVLTDSFKASGHATPNELKLMINFLQPKIIIPVNGEYRQQAALADIANQLGYEDDQIFIPSAGDVIEYRKGQFLMTQEVPAGDILVDGNGVGDIGSVVLRDRRILSEDGICVIVATISRRRKKVLVGPQIVTRGFVYVKSSIDLIESASDMTLDILDKHLASEEFDWAELKSDLREQVSKYFFKETKRRPVVLPIIMEASQYQPNKN